MTSAVATKNAAPVTAAATAPPALEADASVLRDGVPIVRDAVFALPGAAALAILGRNGAGKSTLLHGLFGLLAVEGTVACFGTRVDGLATHRRAAHGMALVPQGRRLFGDLTVAENLRAAQLAQPGPGPELDVLEIFPALRDLSRRRAGVLSGGEQQQVAIARALLRQPRLLVLDEPTEGLAPVIVDQLVETLETLRAAGLTLVIAEQRLAVVERLCTHFLALRAGDVAAFDAGAEGVVVAERALSL